jgi:K+-transporting ATPase A subunit
MWEKIAKEYKRQFKILVFVVLPIILIIGLIIGTKIIQFVGFTVDSRGMAFVSLSLVPLYILGAFSAYSQFRKKKPKQQTTDSESEPS